ncbi:MAG: TolC family protein [Thermoanaerobaculia bacterium]
MRFSSCWILLPFLLLPAARSGAQSIELAELEREALASSPRLAEAAARRDAALALVPGARVAADPALELWVRNALPGLSNPGTDTTEVELMVVQPVRYPGKRGAWQELAAAEATLATAEVASASRAVVTEVRTLYAELVATDREQRVLAEAHELQELLIATARVRFGTGQEEALAVLEAELASNRHDLVLDEVYSRFVALRARLAALTGRRPEELPLQVGTLPEPIFAVFEGPLPFDPEAPRLVAARARVHAAESRFEAARLDLRPDFAVGGGFTWPEGRDPALTAKLGIDLPFLRRRRMAPRVDAAEAALRAEQSAYRQLELELAAQGSEWGAERDRLERALEALSGAVVPRTSAALDAARVAFLNERLPFSRLLELQNEWFHARVDLERVEAERFAVWARWQEVARPGTVPLASEPKQQSEVQP